MFVLLDLVKQNDIFINNKEVYMQVVLNTKGICSSKNKDKNEVTSKAANKKVDLLQKEVTALKEMVDEARKKDRPAKKRKRMTGTEKAKRRKMKAKEVAAAKAVADMFSEMKHASSPLSPIPLSPNL